MKDFTCGIYSILNTVTNKIYIGSSSQIRIRFNKHKRSLKLQIHDNDYLQKSWNKHGEEAFKFEIIELCSREKLLEREQYWMDYYQSYDERFGYNIMPLANGSVLTEESKLKISLSKLGKERPQHVKDALSKAHKGKPTWKLDMWKKTLKDVNELLDFYIVGNSLAECTKKFGIGYAVLKRILKQHNIEVRIGGASQKGKAGRRAIPRIKSICPTCKSEILSVPWRPKKYCSVKCIKHPNNKVRRF